MTRASVASSPTKVDFRSTFWLTVVLDVAGLVWLSSPWAEGALSR